MLLPRPCERANARHNHVAFKVGFHQKIFTTTKNEPKFYSSPLQTSRTDMSTTVTFVDHSLLDRKARRSIRSHALKRKNSARMRALKRPPPHAATPGDERTASHMGTPQYSHDALPDLYSQPGPGMKPIVQVGGELASVSSPCAMTAQSWRTIRDCKTSSDKTNNYHSGLCANQLYSPLLLWRCRLCSRVFLEQARS